jgi:hypothetical protein
MRLQPEDDAPQAAGSSTDSASSTSTLRSRDISEDFLAADKALGCLSVENPVRAAVAGVVLSKKFDFVVLAFILANSVVSRGNIRNLAHLGHVDMAPPDRHAN